jgi:hypothetical protein
MATAVGLFAIGCGVAAGLCHTVGMYSFVVRPILAALMVPDARKANKSIGCREMMTPSLCFSQAKRA